MATAGAMPVELGSLGVEYLPSIFLQNLELQKSAPGTGNTSCGVDARCQAEGRPDL